MGGSEAAARKTTARVPRLLGSCGGGPARRPPPQLPPALRASPLNASVLPVLRPAREPTRSRSSLQPRSTSCPSHGSSPGGGNMDGNDHKLELDAAAAAIVAAPEAAAASVVVAPEAAAAASAVVAPEAPAAASAVVAPEAAAAAASGEDDDAEGTLDLLDEVLEKTKSMKLTEQAVTSSAAAASVESKKENAAAGRRQIYREEFASTKVPFSASLAVAQTTGKTKKKKKLLVLNLTGLLADVNQDFHNAHLSHGRFRGKLVFKRPFCDDFLKFCFHNFEVGVWSSRMRHNLDAELDILMKGSKHRLLFCWDESKCTDTGLYTLENKNKPLVLKELKKLWSNKEADDLPWKQGEFSPSNTLLLDDAPYKALRNPPHTAIFPYPYSYKNRRNDSSLGPGGDVRLYLESLATADDVPRFIRENPFGQPPITETDPNWNFYKRVRTT